VEWRSRQNNNSEKNQSCARAHPPKGPDSSLNAISGVGSPTSAATQIEIYWDPVDRRGRYRVELADGTVLCVSRQPFLDGARAAGYSPAS
jgi:hypothetical protein